MDINTNDTLFASINLVDASHHRVKYDVCLHTPPHIVSDGIWGGHSMEGSPLRSSFPIFLLQVIVIYTITRALHFPVKKLGLPTIISQIMAGIILGPSLKILEKDKMMLFPYGSQDTLATITSLGYVLFVFENGVKMDFSMITRTGKKIWVIALVGLALPLLVCYPTLDNLSTALTQSIGDTNRSVVVMLVTQNITSFAVISSILNDLQILNSELGRLTLSCALVGDILSNILIFSTTVFGEEHNIKILSINLVSLFVLIIIIFFIYRPIMFWVIEHTPERQEVKDIYINIIIGILFTLGWCSMLLKQEFILLPFIFGLATPEGPPLGSSLVKRIHVFGIEFLLPIFLTTCAMKINFGLLEFSSFTIIATTFVVLYGHLLKMIAYVASSRYLINLPLRDAVSFALLLNCKGVVEVSMYSSALDKNDLLAEVYTVIITIIMITSSIAHLLVKRLYDPSRKYVGYQRRNIFNLKPNSGLRIQVCIHKQHNTIPMIRVLDLCNPTPEDPITVDVLHLIELVGRSSPIFISHRMKKRVPSHMQSSYSENIILSFKLYEDEKQDATIINPYTAISPLTFMHEDVCCLALDKVTSIIILPFHRKWSIEGKIEYEDKTIRSLNCKVMEKAPCSVGILVSRYVHQRDSPLRLAMIFLGGKDDREALCLANRAIKDSSVNLVVYHITTNTKNEIQDLDIMLDLAMLKDAKEEYSSLKNVIYKEITVEGGAQIASILRQMIDEHDFFIVGRRHGIDCPQTKGLQEWSEFTELGLIGDFLSSTDLDCKSSVLVVQQQQLS
ncbi:Cation/H(+) antiporter 4, partial [Mucuna pruriens]